MESDPYANLDYADTVSEANRAFDDARYDVAAAAYAAAAEKARSSQNAEGCRRSAHEARKRFNEKAAG